ncbi:hypothetical protein, partial [Polynucleobacter sp.]|uniref:hypothetical protein n=1 Tax=Polynucleobacter sp. TaxID=2029855 RepID=UPI00333E5E17
AYPAVNKLIYESYKADLAVILPSECLSRLPPTIPIHKSRLGHTLKKGKKQGRVTCNYSYGNLNAQLNTDEVREMAREKYGDIELPTVIDLAQMILKHLDDIKQWGHKSSEDLVLWKMDLKGAFTLLFFRPVDCGLLVLPMTDGLSVIHIAGNFGLTLFPFIFNVISRCILRAISLIIMGLICMYIDDIMGVSDREHVDEDISLATTVITNLLGDDAVAVEKTEIGRKIDWIGWEFNLDTMTVSIADHNYYKTLHGFMTVQRGERVKVRTLHTLSSWASRYTLVCPYMAPFSGYLYSAFSGYKNLEVEIVLPTEAFLVILLWRCFFFLMKLEPKGFTRKIEDFRPKGEPHFRIEYDGAPIGIGFIISQYSKKTERFHRIWAVSWCDEYVLNNDSGYQNSMEFIAAIMGLACLSFLGHNNARVEMIGDNTSSLSWLKAMHFRAGSSTAAAIAYVSLNMHTGMKVVSTEYKEGELNRADPLSRRIPPSDFGFTDRNSFTRANAPPILQELSVLLNPSHNAMDETTLLARMAKFNYIFRHLIVPS